MLPTEKASHIFLEADKKTIRFNPTILPATGNLDDRYQNQHLYILSDEEIKKGDWFIANNAPRLCLKIDKDNTNYPYVTKQGKDVVNHSRHWNRVILASTDKSLALPELEQDFIKKYCGKGGIDEVMVDYEKEYVKNREMYGSGMFNSYIHKPKVAPDNTITITPDKDNYTREEVEKLLDLALNNGRNLWQERNNTLSWNDSKLKWIKENL